MTRVLVVEDEWDIASVLQDYLRHAGYEVDHAADGDTALRALLESPPDLALLDVMLPRLDGISVLRQARVHTQLPVIMLTARIEEIDRLMGLELGADDYICKPFSPREVVARVKAVLRRTQLDKAMQPARASGPLQMDDERFHAQLNGVALHLTRSEFRLLHALAQRRGRIISRSQLLTLAYDDDTDVTERAVDSHVKNLRRKLALAAPDFEWIRSVYGIGFAFESP